MARSYRYLHFDVFTDRLFGGNQLAVFPDAHGLTDATMQSIAVEMNFSETTFVFQPEQPGTDVRMRIFTPADEIPIAGHPTIGSTFALARTGLIVPLRDRFVFGLNLGPTPVSLTWRHEELTFAWMTQPGPAFGPILTDAHGAAVMLGLDDAALSATRLPIQVVSCGVPYLLVPIATRRAVDNAILNPAVYSAFVRRQVDPAPHAVFVFSVERGQDDATAYSRMFAPMFGIGEDAATGSATGPLGCYLVRHRVVTNEQAAGMVSLQGVKMGRPSHLHMSIGVEHDEIASVRVGGTAVFAGEGFLHLP